jgi:hypothetical protein
MISKGQIKELCEGLGWIDMGPQKNQWMISFMQEETGRRVNIYFTTMTVSIEDDEHKQHHQRDVTLEDLELILTT